MQQTRHASHQLQAWIYVGYITTVKQTQTNKLFCFLTYYFRTTLRVVFAEDRCLRHLCGDSESGDRRGPGIMGTEADISGRERAAAGLMTGPRRSLQPRTPAINWRISRGRRLEEEEGFPSPPSVPDPSARGERVGRWGALKT